MDYDVLVIGSGIGGMESSIKLADMGYRALRISGGGERDTPVRSGSAG